MKQFMFIAVSSKAKDFFFLKKKLGADITSGVVED